MAHAAAMVAIYNKQIITEDAHFFKAMQVYVCSELQS